VLVLDDVHLVENREGRAALSVLAEQVPAGSRLAVAGREDPPLRTARLRAQGRILEIGAGDLSLTHAEAASLLGAAGVALEEADLAALYQRTEGWATGLYLAALAIREGGSPGGVGFSGGDRFVSEYVESELLGRLSGRRRAFLTRTAVLERLSGPLCEAVLDQPGYGAAATLAELARSNLLLVPLDRRGQWYRYHHLFRDMLLTELERREPDLLAVLRGRAAAWCQRNGLAEEAVEYAITAGDVEAVARLVAPLWLPISRQGRTATLWRWFGWLEDQDGIEGHPLLMVQAALNATTGRPVEAERWANMVDHWQYQDPTRPRDPPAEAWAAVLRAILCRRGVEQMRADADEAARRMAEANIVAPIAALLQGMARVLSGELDDGDAYFEETISIEKVAAPAVLAGALGERSLLAMARGDWSQAEQLAGQARTALGGARNEDNEAMPLVSAVHARLALHRRDLPAARRELINAQRLRPVLTYAFPHLAVQVRIELARVHLALADLAGARTLMREVGDLLRRRPGLGILVGEAEALRAQLASQRGSSVPAASALTGAELRLLPLLATHLSGPEMAAELFLSPHTVKSELKTIYRKLGASTRNEAVTRARELGLLEG